MNDPTMGKYLTYSTSSNSAVGIVNPLAPVIRFVPGPDLKIAIDPRYSVTMDGGTIARTPAPDCPACADRRRHTALEFKSHHPHAGHGTRGKLEAQPAK